MTDSCFDSAVVYVLYIRFWHRQRSSSERFLWESEWEADRRRLSPVLVKGMKNISHKKEKLPVHRNIMQSACGSAMYCVQKH